MAQEQISERLRQTSSYLREVGFSESVTTTAVVAALLGVGQLMEKYRKYILTGALEISRSGGSPQTEADLASGSAIKSLIKDQFPTHEIVEEEAGIEKGVEYQWFVDPLDGTISYVGKQPYFCIGIGVYQDTQPICAVICNPNYRELQVAETGKGAYGFLLNNRLNLSPDYYRLRVSAAQTLVDASVYLDAAFRNEQDSRKVTFFQQLLQMANYNLNYRSTGSNTEHQLSVARGSAELTLTDKISGFWDIAAGSLMIKEADGEFTDRDGNPVSQTTRLALGANRYLHEPILRVLQDCYPSE